MFNTKLRNTFLSITLIGLCTTAQAQVTATTPLADPPQSAVTAAAGGTADKKAGEEKEAADKKSREDFLGVNFGAGLYANVDVKGRTRVQRARVVEGAVRVEEESDAQLGFVLEAHKFINSTVDGDTWLLHGPYAGLVITGDSDGIDTGIIGYMFGFRQFRSSKTLNVGVGVSISPRAQVLGDGIEENKPLPPGETEVRYKETTKYGVAVTVSFGF